jgi:NAD(P)-dependent dehydrogenase (short-subunit alcohol dehydrogenase family)
MQATFDFSGKVVIVTGSTKGLGRAMVDGFADAGAKVVVSSRKQDLCDQVAAELTERTGAEVLPLACHVGDWDAIPAFVENVIERFGRIDVLVNNAGINPTSDSLMDTNIDLWRKVFSVNLEGPLRMATCVAPHMREVGGGSIVNIATVGAYSGGPGVGAYGPHAFEGTRTMEHPREHDLSGPGEERTDRWCGTNGTWFLRASRVGDLNEASGRDRRGHWSGVVPRQ